MLSIAKGLLEEEESEQQVEKARYMAETCPPVSMPRTMQELLVCLLTSSVGLTYFGSICRCDISLFCVCSGAVQGDPPQDRRDRRGAIQLGDESQ